MKTFILLSGVPGAGKSTWAEQYRLSHKNVVVISSDEVRKKVTGEYQNFSKEVDVWNTYFDDILEASKLHDNITVIADSTNLENKYRLKYKDKLDNFDKKVLMIIKKSFEVIKIQNLQRNQNKIVPENILKNMFYSFEEPTQEVIDIFDEYVQIYKWFDSSKVKDSFHFK